MAIRKLVVFAFVSAIWQSCAPAMAQSHDVFQTPAIESNLYREGEVRHRQGGFKEWQASCDEVVRLNQRFCSLYGKGRAADGGVLLGLVVTTNDEGKPAAMLEMPLGVRVSSDIEVSVASPDSPKKVRGKTKTEAPMRLRVVRCDSRFCMTLWQLTPAQLAALNGPGALKIAFKAPRARFGWTAISNSAEDQVVKASVASDGFHEMLGATQLP